MPERRRARATVRVGCPRKAPRETEAMGRIVLTQTVNGITRIVAARHVAEDLALPDTSYDVNGRSYRVKSFTPHAAGLFVDLEPEPDG